MRHFFAADTNFTDLTVHCEKSLPNKLYVSITETISLLSLVLYTSFYLTSPKLNLVLTKAFPVSCIGKMCNIFIFCGAEETTHIFGEGEKGNIVFSSGRERLYGLFEKSCLKMQYIQSLICVWQLNNTIIIHLTIK